MKSLLLLLVLAGCSGCPKPLPKPGVIDMSYSMSACPPTQTVTVPDVCNGLFTVEGLACAKCTGGAGCLDKVDVIYCVTTDCSDPRCHSPADTSSR